jgi:hypothetical protein
MALLHRHLPLEVPPAAARSSQTVVVASLPSKWAGNGRSLHSSLTKVGEAGGAEWSGSQVVGGGKRPNRQLSIVNGETAVPIVNHPCRTAMLSALQIVNGETAVSSVETAVFGNEVGANGRPIVSRQVGVGWGKEEVGRITAVINYKRGRRGGTPAAAQ